MSKKTFNPADWQNKNQGNLENLNKIKVQTDNDIETITARIEAAAVDIAPNYVDWRDLGFALADALGESGRSYYHRLSCFYSGYAENETDKQFNKCLKAHGHGVTIKTLYHLAKQAGISVSLNSSKSLQSFSCKLPKLPKLPKWQFGKNGKIGNIQIVILPKWKYGKNGNIGTAGNRINSYFSRNCASKPA